MNDAALSQLIIDWIRLDSARLQALEWAAQCADIHNMEQWCLAAGFVRNLVWDRLHGFCNQENAQSMIQVEHTHHSNALNDIDLIYFCPLDFRPERDLAIEAYLRQLSPALPWSVKNQARMHLKNHDRAYTSCEDAMSHWPELETAVAVTQDLKSGEWRILAPFGLQSLFNLQLTHNPLRKRAVFETRIADKGWLTRYPQLSLR
ncbi:nucleotidyltransferase family protein [Shewanella acanthi]|uniref:nucleotidyltransferase family protein n=1 Tax=Shewanella acanthi TaxID=2864212 RepID=UPI001C65538D|nr:nucleotidyltransferase family protein [Shewanella acanthi]QYJ80637.1 nucleotidyltransferase family protein [Shewanella acanthi]